MKQFLLTTACILFTLFSFSQDFKVDELRQYYQNSTSEDWIHDFTQVYTYDNGGIKETNILAITASTSQNYYQNNKSYNDNNDVVLNARQDWDSNTDTWDNYSQITYTYNTSNNLESETTQIFDETTMTYVNDTRELYDYSGSDLILHTTQQWITETNSWRDYEKVEITYASGMPTQRVYSNWAFLSSTWHLEDRDIISYNANNLIMSVTTEIYYNNDWELWERSVATYSGTVLMEILEQNWIGTEWMDEMKQINTYDANNNITLTVYDYWDTITSSWLSLYKEEMDYSLANPLSINSFVDDDLKIYPNPANDFINITSDKKIDNVMLYNSVGQLVIEKKDNTKVLNVEDLKSGIYILKLYSGSLSTIKKVLIN